MGTELVVIADLEAKPEEIALHGSTISFRDSSTGSTTEQTLQVLGAGLLEACGLVM